ncbi:MAG: hypothetical protein DRN20_06205 [Thermoplasmata archaeon]|nr:MAG: hypothetical protein DRN20_06205 [Thermoplasmata archaeon]
MPNPIIHITAAVVAGYAVGYHEDNRGYFILLLALLHELIDIDHVLTPGFKTLHNIFVFVIFPVFLYAILSFIEVGRGTTKLQRLAIVFFAMMLTHFFLDLLYGAPMPLLYPVSSETFTLNLAESSIKARDWAISPYVVFTPQQSVILTWLLSILLLRFVEDGLYEGWRPLINKSVRKIVMLLLRRNEAGNPRFAIANEVPVPLILDSPPELKIYGSGGREGI